MYFVETIVPLFAICYLNMCIYLLFVNIILLDTICLLKFLRSCFCSIIRTLVQDTPKIGIESNNGMFLLAFSIIDMANLLMPYTVISRCTKLLLFYYNTKISFLINSAYGHTAWLQHYQSYLDLVGLHPPVLNVSIM